MKITAKKQLIAMALMGSMSQVAIANTANCEENFGPWCDLANFLEQQEATAAGPGVTNPTISNLTNTNFNSEEFGGDVQQQPTSAQEQDRTFVGNVIINDFDGSVYSEGTSSIGSVELVENPATDSAEGNVNVVITFGENQVAMTLGNYNRITNNRESDNAAEIRVVAKDNFNFVATEESKPAEIPVRTVLKNGHGYSGSWVKKFGEEQLDSDVAFGILQTKIGEQGYKSAGYVGIPTALQTINSIQGTTEYKIAGQSSFTNHSNLKAKKSYENNYRIGKVSGTMTADFTNGSFSMVQNHRDSVKTNYKYKNSDDKLRHNKFATLIFNVDVTNGAIDGNEFNTDNATINVTAIHKFNKKLNNGKKIKALKTEHKFESGSINGTFTGSRAQGLVGTTDIKFSLNKGTEANPEIKEKSLKAVFEGVAVPENNIVN